MDRSRSGHGQLIVGAGGILLFAFLFLPWFGPGGGDSLSGWQGLSATDLFLLITAAVAVGAALSGGGPALPGVSVNGAAALLGGVGTVLLIWLVVFDFPDGADRKLGLYLSLIAVAAIAIGGYMAASDEGRGSSRY